jgi:two-component system, sensor histidine kinase and response regulator
MPDVVAVDKPSPSSLNPVRRDGAWRSLSLGTKFCLSLYLMLLPLFVATLWIASDVKGGLEANTRELGRAREVKELAAEAHAHLLTQEVVMQAVLIDPEDYAEADRKIAAYDANLATLRRLQATSDSPELRAAVGRLIGLVENEFVAGDMEILETIGRGDQAAARHLFTTRYKPLMATAADHVRIVGQLAEAAADAAEDRMTAENERLMTNAFAALTVGVLLVGAGVWPVALRVRKRLRRTVEVLQAVAAGDLTRRLDAGVGDEIGLMAGALNKAVESMRAAFQAAEAAGRAKGEFLANMSHEIRTPMNGILGMTELALATDLTRPQREYLELVKSSADALLVVINDILDFSKIEAGKLDLDPIDFYLRDSLGDAMKALALRAQTKGLELVCDIGTDVPDGLVGDPGRLRQVVTNLVGNAIKFTERGEVVLRVRAADGGGAGPHLQFSVVDTGIGIPADKVDKIFAPFEQVDGSTTRKYGGTGLGLSISTRLVALMGGQIWVESELGAGSTFHFTARFELSTRPKSQVPRLSPAELEGLAVLIVDDNATNRRILTEILTAWRMRPVAVEGGAEALAAIRTATAVGHAFPLILMDAMMPGMDGFTASQEIRKLAGTEGTTIMMLSSATPDAADQCQKAGIDRYLTKPVKQSELFDSIAQILCGTEAVSRSRKYGAVEMPLRPLDILLAEDNPVNQKLAVTLLTKAGHTVTVAENGRVATDLSAGKAFDIILMDVQMPVMDGFEAVAAIRARERTGPRTPIIALTAHAMKGDRERCLAAGMDGYVTKPVRVADLTAEILRLRPDAAAEPTEHVEPPEVPEPVEAAPETRPGAPADAAAAAPDRAAALDVVGGDTDLLRELVDLFLEDCPRLMGDLRAAIAASDATGVKRAAHTLKGALQNFGAADVAGTAQALETMGRANDLAGAAPLSVTLERRLAALAPALRAWAV